MANGKPPISFPIRVIREIRGHFPFLCRATPVFKVRLTTDFTDKEKEIHVVRDLTNGREWQTENRGFLFPSVSSVKSVVTFLFRLGPRRFPKSG